METRNELMIYAGKDDYAGRKDGRCAHPNTVRGRIAPRKVEVHGSAFSLARVLTLRNLSGELFWTSRWTLNDPNI